MKPMSSNSEYVWPCCNLVDSTMGGAVDGASTLSNSYVGTKALVLWLSSCTRVPEVSLLNEVLAAIGYVEWDERNSRGKSLKSKVDIKIEEVRVSLV